ncbi:MAG: flagellar hook-basal body protein [Oscillospiraceae bacterium]|nr:flagellar hook-basal body protein [Oscillospiraceae bacterium]
MIQALHTSGLGMLGEQEYLDNTANNIANLHTYGYKKERLNFKDALYVNMRDASDGNSAENLKKGTGVIPNSVSKLHGHGPIIETGRNLDVNLSDEETFFVVEDYNGDQVYTRNGEFRISTEADGNFLVNSSGYYILDNGYNRININSPESGINIDMLGNIRNAEGEDVAQIAIVAFPSVSGLENIGGNVFAATELSGEAEIEENATLLQGYIEGSNVDLGEEMVNMIRAQRAYQLASRVLRTSDEMEGIANSLRK